jgi:tRNA dimethylallyltransferase
MNKILVIVGPTSSGKSELAVKFAKHFNGEIISCDSRQIYKGMDLGTGKVEGKWNKQKTCKIHGREFYRSFVYKNIPHHLIDFINPKSRYSAALFQLDAKKTIDDILSRDKLPILCGGTAHWIDAVVFDQPIPAVKPNLKLRMKLEKKSADNLYRRLKKLDPVRAKNIDKSNKRRLIRALEIVITTGKPVPTLSTDHYSLPTYNALWLGINPPQAELFTKIKKRLGQRLNLGMAKEVLRLHGQGLSWKKLESFGLEYKFIALYLQKKVTYDEMFEQLLLAIQHYSKRQMTWWKRNKEIKWITSYPEALKLTKKVN